MLAAEIAGIAVNKAERNRALQATIPRNRGSIEFKHQNISAVLLGLGQPWITGYKPKANFQGALVDRVLRWLDSHEDWLMPRDLPNRVADADYGQMPFQGPTPERLIRYGVAPSQRNEPPLVDPEFMAAVGRKFDVAARDARNRALGMAGEEAIFADEQRQLRAAGREELARRTRWTSQEDGDGYGYDIASWTRKADRGEDHERLGAHALPSQRQRARCGRCTARGLAARPGLGFRWSAFRFRPVSADAGPRHPEPDKLLGGAELMRPVLSCRREKYWG